MSVAPEGDGAVTPLFNVEKVAEALSVSTRTVRQLIADGELACVRIGDRVLVRPADLGEFIEARVEQRQPKVA